MTTPSQIASQTNMMSTRMILLTMRNSLNISTRSKMMKNNIRNVQKMVNKTFRLFLPLATMTDPPIKGIKLKKKLRTGSSNYKKAKKVSIVSS